MFDQYLYGKIIVDAPSLQPTFIKKNSTAVNGLNFAYDD